MASFSGRFELTGGRPASPQAGACTLSFDKETLQLVSAGKPVLACDLGDIDVFGPGDCILDLTFYTGQRLRLQQFAKAFDNLVHDLLEAYRGRLVKCLLLEDLEEVCRFTGTVEYESPARKFSGASEIRLYRSNLAFLPQNATGLQWRLADVDSVRFDPDAYAAVLQAGGEQVKVTKLAKRTDEFRQRLETTMEQVGDRAARVLHGLFPFLAPDRFPDLAGVMKEGHAVSLASLQAIDPKTAKAIVSNVVDTKLRPYFDHLARLAGDAGTFTGFKMIRPEDAAQPSEGEEADASGDEGASAEAAVDAAIEADESAGEGGSEAEPVLHWFFFRIAPPAATEPLLAWEATSRSGRATYVFRESVLASGGRATSPGAVADRLARGLAFVNFRREPVYLPDDRLQLEPKFRRYAIAARRLPELADLRKAFAGRAIHASPDAWRQQLDKLLR